MRRLRPRLFHDLGNRPAIEETLTRPDMANTARISSQLTPPCLPIILEFADHPGFIDRIKVPELFVSKMDIVSTGMSG